MNYVITEPRKWQCFVCGIVKESYEEFKEHILARHEEGKDFIICPLLRCLTPVRCLISHFRVKHPTEPLPKKGQLRAIVWRDIQSPRKKRKKQPFKEGYVFSIKNGGKQLHYRSSYEMEVYNCLEELDEVISYRVEALSIEYYFKGKRKQYYPDLIITFKDGRTEIWEVKPAKQTTLELNEAKWKAANAYCDAHGWTFMVMTEQGIQKLKQLVRKLNEQKNFSE